MSGFPKSNNFLQFKKKMILSLFSYCRIFKVKKHYWIKEYSLNIIFQLPRILKLYSNFEWYIHCNIFLSIKLIITQQDLCMSVCTKRSRKPLNRYGSFLQCSFSLAGILGEGTFNVQRKIIPSQKKHQLFLTFYF